MNVRKHMEILGMEVCDRITKFKGVATSIGFDLYGCIQVVIAPGIDKDGKIKDSAWFDINRLEVTSKKRVMEMPDFDFGPVAEAKKGPAEKPAFYKA